MKSIDASAPLAERLTVLRQTIPAAVRLIAVTKGVPVAVLRQAYAAGLRDFGESKVQEAIAKQEQLQDLPDITWHLIGHLQGNKAKVALQHFDWIHSVDSLKLAQRLDRLAADLEVQPKACLQVKLHPDPSKYGWSTPDLLQDLPLLDQCQHLKIQGLMTILPQGLNSSEALAVFQAARQLAETIRAQGWQHLTMAELSMGMSEDYPLAIQAGATLIRLGRILFGERSKTIAYATQKNN
jgi:PLP dependent protein